MTGVGVSFGGRVPTGDFLKRVTKFVALATFGLQQNRARENARRQVEEPQAAQLDMLPHDLLLMAIKYTQ